MYRTSMLACLFVNDVVVVPLLPALLLLGSLLRVGTGSAMSSALGGWGGWNNIPEMTALPMIFFLIMAREEEYSTLNVSQGCLY